MNVGDIGKVWGQRTQEKWDFMLGSEHAVASISDAAASATRELDASASKSNAAASNGWQTRLLALFQPELWKIAINIGIRF